MDKKKMMAIIGAVVAVVVVAIGALYAIEKPIKLDNQYIVYELGDDLNFTIKDFIRKDTDGITMDYDKRSIANVGTHDITFKRNGLFSFMKQRKAQVVVQDTLPPEVWKFKSNMILEVTGEPLDLAKYIVAVDQSGLPNINVTSDKKIDTTKEGKYAIVIQCTDMYGNATKREAKLTLLTSKNIKNRDDITKEATEADYEQAYQEIYGRTVEKGELKEPSKGNTEKFYYAVSSDGVKVPFVEVKNEDGTISYKAPEINIPNPDAAIFYYGTPEENKAKLDEEIANMCEVPDWEGIFKTEKEAREYVYSDKSSYDFFKIYKHTTTKCNKPYYELIGIKMEDGASEDYYKGALDEGFEKVSK